MQHRMIENYIVRPLRWLLQNNISYWHSGLHQFQYRNGRYQLVAAATAKPGRIIIVSRLHYQEFVQQYPVTQLTELKQVLKTEFQHQANVLHFIGPEDGQSRTVCSVVISDEMVKNVDFNCILIPETLLLWQAIKNRSVAPAPEVYQVTAFTGYFLNCAAAVPVSQRISNFCPDFSSFTLNNGVSDVARCEVVPDDRYADYLVSALGKTLPSLAKLALFKRNKVAGRALPLKAMTVAASAVAVIYIVAVAGYYQYAIDKRQQQISQLGTDVTHLLDLQQQLQTTATDAEILIQHRADKFYSAHLWQVLIPLLQHDSSLALQNITTENSRIILRGQANQATAVLTALQSSALIEEARFDSSVRRQRDKDIFVISLLMTQQPVAAGSTSEAAAVDSVASREQPEADHAAK
ncbi:hypothetical protein [Arsukibacterium indicum]|uniref:Uncharacterized protein n=1 Tax=Arsukibacterium indicum TaxID=2848612 RepID=A0ABS6MG45_9GAMM|nr:hypothetical protein [Arsukibacterium indicum]MBV2127786.1 hypothetical protein [Arsukibacterium indicum]